MLIALYILFASLFMFSSLFTLAASSGLEIKHVSISIAGTVVWLRTIRSGLSLIPLFVVPKDVYKRQAYYHLSFIYIRSNAMGNYILHF